MRWFEMQLGDIVNGYKAPYSLREIVKAARGEAYSSVVDSGVIIPCSLIVLTKAMMFTFVVWFFSVNPWVHSMRFLCLFKRTICFCLQHPLHITVCCLFASMHNCDSHSPLSLSCESNGSGSSLQDPVPLVILLPNLQTQLCWMKSDPHNTTQPIKSHRTIFASTLKLGLGSHGSDLKSTLDSKFGPQYGLSQPPGTF